MMATLAPPCSATTSRCMDAKDYHAELRPCCRSHLVEMSRCVSEAFDEAGVTYWMDYGTLLGAVRNPLTTWADYPWLPQDDRPVAALEPGIIPHDKDADWGVLYRDWSAAVSALYRRCASYDIKLRVLSGSIKIRLSRENKTNLDLFFWLEWPADHRRAGRMHRLSYAPVDRYKGGEFRAVDAFPLHELQWEGLTLPAPKDPESFLAFRYGEAWRTPIPANHDGVPRK